LHLTYLRFRSNRLSLMYPLNHLSLSNPMNPMNPEFLKYRLTPLFPKFPKTPQNHLFHLNRLSHLHPMCLKTRLNPQFRLSP